ncbi:MAG TPA: hypothetical protein VG388_08420 [Solirubrobacteraceae bacterium]|nr:hypothetical protein [Solirubrobacteraceae bacterium]
MLWIAIEGRASGGSLAAFALSEPDAGLGIAQGTTAYAVSHTRERTTRFSVW